MIYFVEAVNSKNELLHMELRHPEKSGVNVKKITGISPIGAEVYSTPFGVVDGGLYSGSRIPSRPINLKLGMWSYPGFSIEDSRRVIYNWFRIKEEVQLYFQTDTRFITISGYVSDVDVDIFSENEEANITVECVDPYFYSPYIANDAIRGIRNMFEFPFENNSLTDRLLEFGGISKDTRYSIFYDGDISVGFRMQFSFLNDSFHNIYLYNMDTRDRLNIYTDQVERLTGTPLHKGDEIILSTLDRNKGCWLLRNGLAQNAISMVGKNSNWFKLSKGDNVFALSSDYGRENISASVTFRNAYAGI